MRITHEITLDMKNSAQRQIIEVKQGDCLSRQIVIALFDGGTIWPVPEDVTILQVAFYKPDRTGGLYDKMPDDSTACTAAGNLITAQLHPQMFTVNGLVLCELRMLNEDGLRLSTFSWYMMVAESATNKIRSEDYYNFASLTAMRNDIGVLRELQTEEKQNIVAAINEVLRVSKSAKIPIARGQSDDGTDFIAHGELPTVALKGDGPHIGKGTQIVFIPERSNLDQPTLSINGGEAIEIRMRAAGNADGSTAELTKELSTGMLRQGVPYTLTFCGKYWLIDSNISVLASVNDEAEAELMREFAAKAISVSDSDMVAVPVINSMDELTDGSKVGVAKIVRGKDETASDTGCVELPTVEKVTEIVEDSNAFAVENGLVCVPVAEELAVVGGVNSAGCEWYQLEFAEEAAAVGDDIPDAAAYAVMDEPYLKEWGWQCCLHDAAKGDTVSMDLYRWLYRCIKQRFSIVSRMIVIVGLDGVKRTYTCATNGGEAVMNGNSVDGMYYLNIPLVQFPNLTQQYLKNMLYRVKEDNPDLLYTRMPNTSFLSHDYEGDPYSMGVNGGYSCVYSMEVSNERADEMMETVNAAVNTIKEKLAQVHGIAVGQSLTVAQKVTVAKVIHDYICTFAHGQYEEEGQDAGNYWASILYSAFDPQLKSRCSGYTQAFNYVARMYGIESIYMSGVGYVDTNEDGDYADYGESGGHAWVAIRLSDEPYGTYPNDSHKWSCIDVYWDEPTHEAVVSGVSPARDDIIWNYFLNIDNIFPKVGSERYQRAHRSITTTSGYGMYPTALLSGMDAQPKLHMPYNGETNEFGGNT